MKVLIRPPAGRRLCFVLPTGLLANSLTASILWSALNIVLPFKVAYALPKKFIKELRGAKLPPGMPLVDILDQQGTQIQIEL